MQSRLDDSEKIGNQWLALGDMCRHSTPRSRRIQNSRDRVRNDRADPIRRCPGFLHYRRSCRAQRDDVRKIFARERPLPSPVAVRAALEQEQSDCARVTHCRRQIRGDRRLDDPRVMRTTGATHMGTATHQVEDGAIRSAPSISVRRRFVHVAERALTQLLFDLRLLCIRRRCDDAIDVLRWPQRSEDVCFGFEQGQGCGADERHARAQCLPQCFGNCGQTLQQGRFGFPPSRSYVLLRVYRSCTDRQEALVAGDVRPSMSHVATSCSCSDSSRPATSRSLAVPMRNASTNASAS